MRGSLGDRIEPGDRLDTRRQRSSAFVEWEYPFGHENGNRKIVGGKVVLEGVSLEEGTSVTVLAKDDEAGFDLTPVQEAELLLSFAEADRGGRFLPKGAREARMSPRLRLVRESMCHQACTSPD